ncbi:MAG: GNAT family N-acetyltransferase, partial [Bacteroidota bacterium]
PNTHSKMKTPRAFLELIKTSDFPDVLAMFKEPGIFRFIGPLENQSDAFYREMLTERLRQHQIKYGYYWVARLHTTRDLIGCMNLNPFRGSGKMQLGFQIHPKWQGKGFATELSLPIIEFAKQELQLAELHAYWEKENIASGKVLEKLGFEYVESRRFRDDVEDVLLEVVRLNLK